MKNKTWVKICSVALSLIMSLSMVGGLFVSAETGTGSGSDFVVVDGTNPVTGAAVGATTTAKTTAGNTSTITAPTVDANAEYDKWDGTTYDTDWEVAATDDDGNPTAYYITTAEELWGLKKASKDAVQGTFDNIDAAAATYNAAIDAYLADTANVAIPTGTFPVATGDYIGGTYVNHAYSGITFYVTANIDMTGYTWDGLGSTCNWVGFDGNIVGWDKDANAAKTVYIKGMDIVPTVDVPEKTWTYTTVAEDGTVTEGNTATLTGTISRVGFIATHSGSEIKNLTFVAPTATLSTGCTGLVVGQNRRHASTYENVNVVGGTVITNTALKNIGGFVGYSDTNNSYTDCYVDVDFKLGVKHTAGTGIGGYVGGGKGTHTFNNCGADVDVDFTVNAGANGVKVGLGGFYGFLTEGTISLTNCSVDFDIADTGDNCQAVGGYVGLLSKASGTGSTTCNLTFTNCAADVNINMLGGIENLLGGYIGWYNTTAGTVNITDSKVSGQAVFANGEMKVCGGFIGSANRSGATISLSNSYSDFDFTATKATNIGGMIGVVSTSNTTVDKCVYEGTVIATGTANNGGFIGGVYGFMGAAGTQVTNCEISLAVQAAQIYRLTFGGITGGGAAAAATNGKVTFIDNCTVHLDVVVDSTTNTNGDEFRSGGILGYSSSNGKYTISDCVVDGTVDVTGGGAMNFGGIACVMQLADQKISGCVSSIDFSAAGKSYGIGGIVAVTGGAKTFNVSDCLWNGKMSISAELFDGTGGIWGYAANANAILNISNCVAAGTFESTGASSYLRRCGGIVGSMNAALTANITNCESYCDFVQNGSTSYIAKNAQILADSRNASATIIIDGCTAGGTLTSDATSAEALGGITGYIVGPFTVKNSISNMDFYMTADIDGTAQATIGGIAGIVPGGSTATITNCYYGGTIDAGDVGKQIGGFIGGMHGGSASITNSQMEGVISSGATQTGALVGRYQLTADGSASLTLTDIVVSGMAAGSNGYQMIGLVSVVSEADSSGSLNYSNIYSQISMPIMPWNDYSNVEASDNGTPDDTTDDIAEAKWATILTINDGDAITATSNAQYADHVTDVIAEATFDSTVWTTETDGTPVLAVAADADRVWKSADITWFDPSANPAGDDLQLTTDGEVYGYAMLMNLAKFRNAYLGNTEYVFVAKTDCLVEEAVADGVFYAGTELTPTHYCAHNDTTDTCGKAIPMATLDVQYQLGTKHESEPDWVTSFDYVTYAYNLRVIAAVTSDLEGYDSVGFIVTMGDQKVTLTTHTVYETVIGSDATGVAAYDAAGLFGDEASYMFATTFLEVPVDTTFTIQAFAICGGEVVTGAVETVTVTADGISAN